MENECLAGWRVTWAFPEETRSAKGPAFAPSAPPPLRWSALCPCGCSHDTNVLNEIRTVTCVCFLCAIFVCVCVHRSKHWALWKKSPPPHPPPSHAPMHCTQTSFVLVQHIYNVHNSCPKRLDCLSLTSCIHFSFTCFSATIHPSLFHPIHLPGLVSLAQLYSGNELWVEETI